MLTLCATSLLILLWGCAQQVPLTGGPKDEIPPQIDTIQSLSNYQIRFIKQDIILYFDEYVDLRDPAKQIIISPPLTYPPKIENRLKKVEVRFDDREALKEQATYVINFGSSIADFTEGNKLENFTYVFSTGDFIDSLSIKGMVIDAFTGLPSENMVVMLYTNTTDSVIYKEKPFYFARTDKEGLFRINNLRADTFKIAVIGDLNLNYTYDPGVEYVGFLDTLYPVSTDTSQMIVLEVFKEVNKAAYNSYDVKYQGKIDITFDPYVDTSAVRILDSITYYWSVSDDNPSIASLWYRPSTINRIQWETQRNGRLDTIAARINLRSTDTLPGPISIVETGHSRQIGLHPSDTLTLLFSSPISVINSELILALDTTDRDTLHPLIQDTIPIIWTLTQPPGLKLEGSYPWSENQQFNIQFLPGAIVDMYNKPNDTIDYPITIASADKYGSISLTLEQFDSSVYILQLLEKDKIASMQLYTSADSIVLFDKLKPAEYNLLIIQDDNSNMRWDPGNYTLHRQSESVWRAAIGSVTEGELIEKTLSFKDLKKILDKPKTSEATPRNSGR